MRSIFPYLLISIISIYIYSCANQGSPTGGPKDTIPPTLLESHPNNETINFKEKEFYFVFDERINADKIKSKLIITPYTENDYKVKVKKNELTIIFEEDFEDSTTYTFNFADAVVDVTEKNPVENFSLAFSTGPYIDSITVSGYIKNLYDNSKAQKTTVSLYAIDDTLNVITGKPLYFAQTDTSGYYEINNIKNGYYRVYSFEDANNNLTADTDTEKHGFISDTLNLNTNQENVDMPVQLIDATELRYVRSKQTGRYFDIIYSKYVDTYQINRLSNKLPIPSVNLTNENKTLRFYYDSAYRYDMDSLAIEVIAQDSISNYITDTTYIKFSESKRKPQSFSYSINPKSTSKINEQHLLALNFNKPIIKVQHDSISLMYDTLIVHNIPDSIYKWNTNKTKLTIENKASKTILKNLTDSLLATLIDTTAVTLELDSLAADTVAVDTVKLLAVQYLKSINTNKILYKFKKGSFISIENDSSESDSRLYEFKDEENFGKISGTINTSHSSYTLQLVNPKYEVIDSKQSPKQFTFDYVSPGKYTFRILIDDNNDGTWDSGNIHNNEEPESTFFYAEQLDIRANWEIENIDITF